MFLVLADPLTKPCWHPFPDLAPFNILHEKGPVAVH